MRSSEGKRREAASESRSDRGAHTVCSRRNRGRSLFQICDLPFRTSLRHWIFLYHLVTAYSRSTPHHHGLNDSPLRDRPTIPSKLTPSTFHLRSNATADSEVHHLPDVLAPETWPAGGGSFLGGAISTMAASGSAMCQIYLANSSSMNFVSVQ